jgi:hypothetical protein
VRASQIVRTHSVRLVGAAPLGEPGDSPEMDGGIEQNPAYGTALTFTYAECARRPGALTPILTPTRKRTSEIRSDLGTIVFSGRAFSPHGYVRVLFKGRSEPRAPQGRGGAMLTPLVDFN